MTKEPFDGFAREVAAEEAATSGGAVGPEDAADAVNTEAVNDDPGMPSAPVASDAGDPGTPDRGADNPGAGDGGADADAHPDTLLAASRLEDLQRLNAEYVNYKRRVDRDRALTQERVVRDVLESLLPVLDDIQGAREHGDLADGPFAAIADKLEASLAKYGLVRFGDKGELFDPVIHEALMHQPWPADDPALDGAEGTTVVMVLQPGYRAGDAVIRPARVAVADPA